MNDYTKDVNLGGYFEVKNVEPHTYLETLEGVCEPIVHGRRIEIYPFHPVTIYKLEYDLMEHCNIGRIIRPEGSILCMEEYLGGGRWLSNLVKIMNFEGIKTEYDSNYHDTNKDEKLCASEFYAPLDSRFWLYRFSIENILNANPVWYDDKKEYGNWLRYIFARYASLKYAFAKCIDKIIDGMLSDEDKIEILNRFIYYYNRSTKNGKSKFKR